MAGADEAAVVLVGLEMDEAAAGGAERTRDRLLLHIHVEAVEHEPNMVLSHLVEELDSLPGRVENVAFETVQGLDRERHPGRRGPRTRLLQRLDDAALALGAEGLVDRGRGATGEDEGAAGDRPADDSRPERRRRLDGVGEIVEGG